MRAAHHARNGAWCRCALRDATAAAQRAGARNGAPARLLRALNVVLRARARQHGDARHAAHRDIINTFTPWRAGAFTVFLRNAADDTARYLRLRSPFTDMICRFQLVACCGVCTELAARLHIIVALCFVTLPPRGKLDIARTSAAARIIARKDAWRSDARGASTSLYLQHIASSLPLKHSTPTNAFSSRRRFIARVSGRKHRH